MIVAWCGFISYHVPRESWLPVIVRRPGASFYFRFFLFMQHKLGHFPAKVQRWSVFSFRYLLVLPGTFCFHNKAMGNAFPPDFHRPHDGKLFIKSGNGPNSEKGCLSKINLEAVFRPPFRRYTSGQPSLRIVNLKRFRFIWTHGLS